MSLINCPECSKKISDKAEFCPHCGLPLALIESPDTVTVKKGKPKKMRLPNGFGQITKIKGKNLRNPYRVHVNTTMGDDGKYKAVPLKPKAYFPTYEAAYQALLDWHKDPNVDMKTMTMQTLFERYIEERSVSDPDYKGRRRKDDLSLWQYCRAFANELVCNMRIFSLKKLIRTAEYTDKKGKYHPATASTKTRLKYLLNKMFDHALELDIVTQNYARMFKLDSSVQKEITEGEEHHIPFTDEEINILWNNVDKNPFVKYVLIQIYTGFRPSELGALKRENVDLLRRTLVGGMKTRAGINRIVPIHSRIYPLVLECFDESVILGSEWLLNYSDVFGDLYVLREDTRMDYNRYRTIFSDVLKQTGLNTEHTPHDCRTTFITRAKEFGMDEYCIKLIVGHYVKDLTENTYTLRSLAWFWQEIEKIA